MEQREMRRHFSALGMAYFVYVAVSLAVQFVILLLLQLLGTDVSALGSTASMAVSVAAMYLAAFPVCLALLRRIPSSPLPREEREPMSFWSLLLCLVVCIGVMEAGNLIGNGLMGITSLFLDRQIDNTVVDMVLAGELIPVVLFAAILAPIFEELLFRKLLIDRIRVFGDRTCILVSGVMFGLIHGNFYQFFYACGLGMVFAYVYLRTGRVRNTIGLHMAINSLGGVVGTVLLRWFYSAAPGNVLSADFILPLLALGLYVFALMASAIAGVVLLICLWGRRRLERGIFEIPASRRFQTAFLNVGMLLFFLICTVQFGLSLSS